MKMAQVREMAAMPGAGPRVRRNAQLGCQSDYFAPSGGAAIKVMDAASLQLASAKGA